MSSAKGATNRGKRTTAAARTPKGSAEAPERWDPIIVVWDDAWEMDGSHLSSELESQAAQCTRRTIGFLISLNDERVISAGDDDRGVQKVGGNDCETVNVIPCSMIKEIIRLRAD